MAHDPAIDALLAEARADFAARLPAKVAELDLLISREAWEEARRAAHKVRGSAATYGFAALGVVAAALEEALLSAGAVPDADTRASIADLSRDARAAADRATEAQ